MNRIPNRPPHSAGFTLVEIMVVIVIIGILATLVVPNVIGSSDEARATAARSNCESLAGQVRLYRSTKGKLPRSLQDLASDEEKSRPWYIESLPKDPWDHDFELREGDRSDEWEVISGGPNGSIGDDDDISSRPKKEK